MLQAVRTGMGGMMLVIAVALLLKNKVKAIPGLLVAGGLFFGVVLFVPEVNEKFFGEDAGTVSVSEIMHGEAMSLDKIEKSGREYIWEHTLDNCYRGHELTGKGLGEAEYYSKHIMTEDKNTKIHNDYIVLLCDTGLVGIILLVLFYFFVIIKVSTHVLRRSTPLVKFTGIMALSSMVGIGFCMYFDNVVSNSMQSMVMPYIYLGFFLKALDMEETNSKTFNIRNI